MNFDQKVYNVLHNRQININNKLGPSYFEHKIIKSCYDSIDNFYSLKNAFEMTRSFIFSGCGNYLAERNTIWKIKENFSFQELYDFNDDIYFESNFKSMAFNKDSTKFFFSEFTNPNYGNFSIIDLSEIKTVSKTEKHFEIIDISCSSSNPDLIIYGDYRGIIHINDLRSSSIEIIKKNVHRLRSIQYNPIKDHLLLVTSGSINGVYALDLRNNQNVMNYNILFNNQFNIKNGCYNKTGDQILLNRTYSNPLLYCSDNPYPIYEFDEFGFLNYFPDDISFDHSKESCFLGPGDEFVAVASRNDKVYIWEIPKKKLKSQTSQSVTKIDSAKFIVKHFTQVNYLQYNYRHSVLGCSGRNEPLKFWSPFGFAIDSFKNYNTSPEEITDDLFYHANFSFLEFMDDCLLMQIRKHNHIKEYFMLDFESFTNINTEDFLNDLKKDLNIFYIKQFILEYETEVKCKNFVLLKKIKQSLEEDYDFETRFFEKQYLSIMHELYKLFLTKNFLKKSIDYLDIQINKIRGLKRIIRFTKNDINQREEKISLLVKIKVVLKTMIADLKLILLKDKIYVNSIKLIGSLFELFKKTAPVGRWHKNVDLKESELFCYDSHGWFLPWQIRFEKIKKVIIPKTKISKYQKYQDLALFKIELIEDTSRLKSSLKKKNYEIIDIKRSTSKNFNKINK